MDDLPEVFKIEEKDIEAPSSGIKKKQKTGEHLTKGNKVLNTDPNPEYKMLEGEDFKKYIAARMLSSDLSGTRQKGPRCVHVSTQNITVLTIAIISTVMWERMKSQQPWMLNTKSS